MIFGKKEEQYLEVLLLYVLIVILPTGKRRSLGLVMGEYIMQISVQKVPKSVYSDWLLNKHYAKRLCSVSYAYGLYIGGEIKGVVTYGMSPSATLAESIAGEDYKKIVYELNRLITVDDLPKNVLSQFVTQSFKLLPKPLIIVSFADPNSGHHGYIYQATNFIYTGVSSNSTQFEYPDGTEFHFKNFRHKKHSSTFQKELGKTKDEITNQDIIEFYDLKKKNIEGKHRYIYIIGSKTQKKQILRNFKLQMLAYPKGENNNYEVEFSDMNTQLNLFGG